MQKEFNPIMKLTGLAYLAIIVIILLMASCATQTRCAGKFPCIVKDSVSVITKLVEMPVILTDTAYIRSFYPNPCADMCDSLGRLRKGFSMSVQNSKGTSTTIKESGGKLVAETGLTGIKSNAAVPQTTISSKTGYSVQCQKNHQTGFETFLIWSGGIMWVIVILIIIANL